MAASGSEMEDVVWLAAVFTVSYIEYGIADEGMNYYSALATNRNELLWRDHDHAPVPFFLA
jgi:hypothetical protein